MAGTVWVVGAGRFGRRATERLVRRWRVIVVDPSEAALQRLDDCPAERVCEDGVGFVVRELGRGKRPDWIVPALPIHLAAEWALRGPGAGQWRRCPVPAALLRVLPNPVEGAVGDVYVSRATFLCPPDCPEPAEHCLYTGEPRGTEMYRGIAEAAGPIAPALVVRSRQLGPGIGGYRPEALDRLAEGLAAAAGLVIVATACRCHGVITCIERAGGEETM